MIWSKVTGELSSAFSEVAEGKDGKLYYIVPVNGTKLLMYKDESGYYKYISQDADTKKCKDSAELSDSKK